MQRDLIASLVSSRLRSDNGRSDNGQRNIGAHCAGSAGSKAAPRRSPARRQFRSPCKVNGATRTLQVEPRTTLAEALRGPLGLTGTKIACNRGACSACTVWLDGLPICSCMILALDVGARSVTTIEGLAHGEALHPVQQAFIDHDALQCGFCTPGLVMSCAALLARTPEPNADDVRAAISGHYCRCGTYPHVITATLEAAKARKG